MVSSASSAFLRFLTQSAYTSSAPVRFPYFGVRLVDSQGCSQWQEAHTEQEALAMARDWREQGGEAGVYRCEQRLYDSPETGYDSLS